MPSNAFAEAERLSHRRARMIPALAVMFICQQAIFISSPIGMGEAVRPVDLVRAAGGLLLTLVLLAGLSTTGFWFKSREVRALMEDEVTKAHRAQAMSLGFLVAMLTAIGWYVAVLFTSVDPRLVLHTVISAGIATGLIRFSILERRALRGG